ncbi:ABC transporter permease, partial [bacterium]|nr:ABC transporter permease [bacterium]
MNMKVIIPIVFLAPVLQTVIFGYAAVFESKNISIAIIDRDISATSREFRQTLENCGYFVIIDD